MNIAVRRSIRFLKQFRYQSIRPHYISGILLKIPFLISHSFCQTTKFSTSTYFPQLPRRATKMLIHNLTVETPVNRSMHELDRDFFKVEISLLGLQVKNPKDMAKFRAKYENELLQLRDQSNIVKIKDGQMTTVVVILNPKAAKAAAGTDVTTLSGISDEFREFLLQDRENFKVVEYTLVLDYDYWKAEQILSSILPTELLDEVPVGFTLTGHIAHMNLRSQYLPYKNIIGQVILDKNASVRTVVNKLDTIDSVFRTFDMEVIAGDKDLEVEQRQMNCRFKFDFSKVYWNTRLEHEHRRIIEQFQPGEVVCDVMAGVGPFAIPAGKNKVIVLANDLNEACYNSMVENIKLNKVDTVFPYNLDGRDFIRRSRLQLAKLQAGQKTIRIQKRAHGKKSQELQIPLKISRYVMNLPHAAIEFLDAFRGLMNENFNDLDSSDIALSLRKMSTDLPIVHVYGFHKFEHGESKPTEQQVHEDIQKRIAKALDFDIPLSALDFHNVRHVSPTKDMYCVTFQLPAQVAYAKN
ncbi:uncharacterized protein V1516DRAFT_676114 [Lipomyces oligophaga]|uniref:uncharacterized protein n=1 Tax=Lipomyces oligophaga TaxID=45792 RepID=UPI0034CDE2AA